MLTLHAKVVGQKKALFSDWQIPLPPDPADGNQWLLRDLITHTVHTEITAFEARQEERRFERVLSRREIDEASRHGKIDSGGRQPTDPVDRNLAVGAALQAFEDGLYYVFIDDEQYEQLDDPVYLAEDSTVRFVRLVPLVGG